MTVFEKATLFAVNAHAGQARKSKGTPYILHPLEAATIVGRITKDEEVMAAAVLHDTLEDTSVTKAELEKEFGKRIADLVEAESEDKMRDIAADESWILRKKDTIKHLRNAGADVKLVCFGDKLANLREMRADYDVVGDKLWERFNQKDKALHCWYYESILDAVSDTLGDIPEVKEYGDILSHIFC